MIVIRAEGNSALTLNIKLVKIMKKQINDLLLKMQTGENCIGETANALLNLYSVSNCADLKNELEVTDKLLEERQRVLEAIPECPSHGKCVPHAIEWIEEMKAKHCC